MVRDSQIWSEKVKEGQKMSEKIREFPSPRKEERKERAALSQLKK